MNQMYSALLRWLGGTHPVAILMSFAANAIAVGGFLWLLWISWLEPIFFPWVAIECLPAPIRSHEHMLFGRYAPARGGYQVRLYVYPEDGEEKYWLIDRRWGLPQNGVWVDLARFGNPNGRGMKLPPPLYFRVFAVLVKAGTVVNMPGSDRSHPWVEVDSEEKFVQLLKTEGVTAVSASCRVERLENPQCDERPVIISPGRTATSSVRLLWEPNMPMYVELWKDGGRVMGQVMDNGTDLPLTPGTWELKVAPGRDFECLADVWFNVQSAQR